jgi:hypothetical protein
MQFNLDEVIEKIINHNYFQLTKKIIENNENHINDPVYEHQVRTFQKAKEFVKGDLITQPEAKAEFDKLMKREIDGIKKEYLLQIVSLLHDIGKIIIFIDDKKDFSLVRIDENNQTTAPVHEYWSSIIAGEILNGLSFPSTASDFIANCIRLHNAGFNFWFEDISNEKRLFELKLRSENLHPELIFGTYCDLFYGEGFKNQLGLPLALLNMPQTYQNLEYKTI